MSALFTRDGDILLPSELTRGGWSNESPAWGATLRHLGPGHRDGGLAGPDAGCAAHRGSHQAVEIRTQGGSFAKPGPGISWFRLLVPVVEGEDTSDLGRIATLAVMANGNSQSLDPIVHAFINPDISLHLHRLPRGEWIGMRSVSYLQPHGTGMADTSVYDLEGRIGRIVQSQYIEPR